MTRNARLITITAMAIAAGGAQLAPASGAPVQAPRQNATTVSTAQRERPGTLKVLPPDLQRISALTEEECEGLGGVVSTGGNDCKTGELCETTSHSGVIHQSCITRK